VQNENGKTINVQIMNVCWYRRVDTNWYRSVQTVWLNMASAYSRATDSLITTASLRSPCTGPHTKTIFIRAVQQKRLYRWLLSFFLFFFNSYWGLWATRLLPAFGSCFSFLSIFLLSVVTPEGTIKQQNEKGTKSHSHDPRFASNSARLNIGQCRISSVHC